MAGPGRSSIRISIPILQKAMIPEELADIVTGLKARTREGGARWQKAEDALYDSIPKEGYFLSTDEYPVHVRGGAGEAVAFTILDGLGDRIYEFTVDTSDADYAAMEELVELARRSALHVFDALDYLRRYVAGKTE